MRTPFCEFPYAVLCLSQRPRPMERRVAGRITCVKGETCFFSFPGVIAIYQTVNAVNHSCSIFFPLTSSQSQCQEASMEIVNPSVSIYSHSAIPSASASCDLPFPSHFRLPISSLERGSIAN